MTDLKPFYTYITTQLALCNISKKLYANKNRGLIRKE